MTAGGTQGAKAKVLEERQRFQEERQKLTAQVRPWLSHTLESRTLRGGDTSTFPALIPM